LRRRATVDLPDVMIGAEVVYRITPWTGGIRIYLGENDPNPITTLTAPGGRAMIPLGEPVDVLLGADVRRRHLQVSRYRLEGQSLT